MCNDEISHSHENFYLHIHHKSLLMFHGNLHVQHTPNPEAQEPPFTPPLLEHSSLKK